MRGRDPDSGEFFAPSRSELRRQALAVFDLAERLAGLSDAQLATLPIPDDLLDPIRHARSIGSHIARKRELQHLAKLMRRYDDSDLDPIRAALTHDARVGRVETARLHRAEAWRERLIEHGDVALAELVAEHPELDRQAFRAAIRKARAERSADTPPHGQRDLFRRLRHLFETNADGDASASESDWSVEQDDDQPPESDHRNA
ncbi:MAG TPA: ribosome-associated protein [Xanthomonadales bacterium]|nr:ribosome-associated protein [Xanthomonadales bacterium]